MVGYRSGRTSDEATASLFASVGRTRGIVSVPSQSENAQTGFTVLSALEALDTCVSLYQGNEMRKNNKTQETKTQINVS